MDSSQFVRTAARALATGKALARQFAKNPVKFIATGAFLGAEKAVRGLARGMGSIVNASARMARTVATIGLPLLAAGLIAGTAHAYAFGSEMQDMADRTGISVEKLVVLTQAMKDNGIEAESLLSASRKINTTLVDAAKGSQTAAAAFTQVGLKVDDILAQEPGERFTKIGEAIGDIKDPAARSAAAVALLGKSGAQFLSLFADKDAMKIAAMSVGSQANIFGRNAAVFDRISDRIGRIQMKIRGLFAGLAEAIAPMVDKFSEMFDKMDFAPLGAKIGEAIKTGMTYLVALWNDPEAVMGTFWEYAKTQAKTLGNILIDAGIGLANILIKTLSKIPALAMLGIKLPELKTGDDHLGANSQPIDKIGTKVARAARLQAALSNARDQLGFSDQEMDETKITKRRRLVGKLVGSSSPIGASMAGELAKFKKFNARSILRPTGSLSDMHSGAYGASSLLSHREIEAYRSSAAARGIKSIDGEATRRPGEVHRGDAARRKAFLKDEERKRLKGLTEVEALNEIVKSSKKTAEATSTMAGT